MGVLDSKKTYRNLKKKGFTDSTHRSKDHKYLELLHDGKHVLHTKISHSSDDIGDYLIKQMQEQCKLTKSEFMDLAQCPMNKTKFFSILKKKNLLK